MFIRRIYSDNLFDYQREFASSGINISIGNIRKDLNPHLTLKFGNFDPSYIPLFSAVLADNVVNYWSSGKNLFVTFYNWAQIEKIFGTDSIQIPRLRQLIQQLKSGLVKENWEFNLQGGFLKVDRPLIMGILNVTPDSFSDGGQFYRADQAYQHALRMVEAGADIIDIGAESTRPGAGAVDLKEEWRRLEGVLHKLRPEISIPISIDTYKSEIARWALDSGADIINDISGLTFDPQMVKVASRVNCPVIVMHIKGTPRDMQLNPHYDNLMEELHQFFQQQIEYAEGHGLSQLILDPGIGFGKRLQDNLEIIRRLTEFRSFGLPLLLGPSRKSFIGKVLDVDPEHRLMGTAAMVALALNNGARILRVHDVAEMKQISGMVNAVNNSGFFRIE